VEVRRYTTLIRRWLWLIVLCAILAGGTAYVASKLTAPTYQGEAVLVVIQSRAASLDPSSYYDNVRLTATYAELLQRRPVLQEVIQRLGLQTTAPDLAKAVKVQPIRNTWLIRLTAEDKDPARAAAIANAIPQVFVQQNNEMQTHRFADSEASLQAQMQDNQTQISQLQDGIAKLRAQPQSDLVEIDRQQRDLRVLQNNYSSLYQNYENLRAEEARQLSALVITENALPPEHPIRPKTTTNTLIAAIAGAVLACGLIIAFDSLRVSRARAVQSPAASPN
jgi:capsular polysaccharide biosynthesis protein